MREYLHEQKVQTYQIDDLLDDMGIDLWSDFEAALGKIHPDDVIPLLENEAKADEPEDLSKQYNYITNRASMAFNTLWDIHQFLFRDWVESIDISKARKKLTLSPSDIYLTFNYTETLEDIYCIPSCRVCHIHGLRNTGSAPIVGHGKKDIPHYNGAEWAATDEVIPEIYKFLETSYKDVDKIIKAHSSFFGSLTGIDEVFVCGFSFGDVDIPYLQEVINRIGRNTKWNVTYYRSEEERKFKEILTNKLHIPPKNITMLDSRCFFKLKNRSKRVVHKQH